MFKKMLPAILMIVLGIVIGILMIIDAQALTTMIFRIIGIGLIVLAVVIAIRYLIDRKHGEANVMSLATAVIALMIGLVLSIGAEMIVGAGSLLIAIFYGSVLIINGILKIAEYFSIKKQGAAASGVRIVSGLLSIVIGVLAFVFCGHDNAMEFLGIIIGISLIGGAILDIAALCIAYRMNKSMIKIYDTSGDDKDYDLE